LTLGTVIMRLSDKKNSAPIPYRDSKLTRLLQPALEGSSKVSIICNISPSSDAYDETLSTLKFAQRAKKIKQTLAKNDTNDSKALIIKYEREISALQEKLREMEMKMAQEENSASTLDISIQLSHLQEEKEISDARLDTILQEKLQLQQDLERLKSFIISSEDVKPVKLLFHEEEVRKKLAHTKTGVPNRYSMIVSPVSKVEPFHKLSDVSDTSKGEGAIKEFDEEEDFDLMRRETLLIKGIENIEDELENDPLKNVSVLGGFEIPKTTGGKPTYEESLKIIDEQTKVIEEMRRKLSEKEQMMKIVEEQNRIIAEMKKTIEDKDEELELVRDELKLCRNNLTKIQVAMKMKSALKK
jgi:hypothetical protein